MYRIKSITYVLKCLGMISLSAAIKPDRNQGKQCKSLLYDVQFKAANLHRIIVSSQNFHVYIVQACKLPQKAPPFSPPKEIKYHHSQDTGAEIIHHGKRPQCQIKNHNQKTNQPGQPPLFLPFHLFYNGNGKQSNQKRPENILMKRINNRAAVEKIKRNF